MAKAIYKMKKFGVEVLPPDINLSDIEFTPNEEDNTILFGLGGISGINIDISKQIIENRPYKNFEDFYAKNCKETNPQTLITKSKFVALIKAGCFDKMINRVECLRWFTFHTMTLKDSLTTSNIPNAINIGVDLPIDLIRIYRFKKYVCSKEFFYCNDTSFKSKKHYLLESKYALPFFMENFADRLVEEKDYYFSDVGVVVIDKSLDKALKPELDKLKAIINSKKVIEDYNRKSFIVEYEKLSNGTNDISKWGFSTTCFYPNDKHELESVYDSDVNICRFNDLPEEPVYVLKKGRNGREWRNYDLTRVCGTVLDKKDNGHFINLLTPEFEVIEVKFNKGQYAFYKQEIEKDGQKDPSYFARGTLLMITGYRMGETTFVAKKYSNSLYQHACIRINKINEDGSYDLQLNRLGQED